MKWLCGLLAGLILISAIAEARAQVGYDRRGDDYASFTIRSGDPVLCAARCDREGRCRAWNFVYPADDRGGGGTCWLKNQVPARVQDACCTSGVKGTGVIEPRSPVIEYSMDRFGGDYRSLAVAADPEGGTCKAACDADGRCRAWTYLRPGYGGGGPRCFLKEKVLPPRRKPCCISGVVR